MEPLDLNAERGVRKTATAPVCLLGQPARQPGAAADRRTGCARPAVAGHLRAAAAAVRRQGRRRLSDVVPAARSVGGPYHRGKWAVPWGEGREVGRATRGPAGWWTPAVRPHS